MSRKDSQRSVALSTKKADLECQSVEIEVCIIIIHVHRLAYHAILTYIDIREK